VRGGAYFLVTIVAFELNSINLYTMQIIDNSLLIFIFLIVFMSCTKSSENGNITNNGTNTTGNNNAPPDSGYITIENNSFTPVYYTNANSDSILINSRIENPYVGQNAIDPNIYDVPSDSPGTVTYKGAVGTSLVGVARTSLSVPFITSATGGLLVYSQGIFSTLPNHNLLGSVITWQINQQFSKNLDTIYLNVPNNFYCLAICAFPIPQSYNPIVLMPYSIDSIIINYNTSFATLLNIPGGVPAPSFQSNHLDYVIG
jgi:hypothetical protein